MIPTWLPGIALAVAVPTVASTPAAAEPSYAIDGTVTAGVDADTTAIGRLMAGGLIGFGQFGIDAQLSFEAFLRLTSDSGVSARAFGLPNVGIRYGFRNDRFHGPYVAAGGGFGIISGKPRDRKLAEDMETCPGFDVDTPGNCTFDVDRHLNGRLGFGWGFASGEKTTVAVRLDLTYWIYSVSSDQERGSPPASRVARPQDALAVMIGLEFLRWR